MKLFGLALTFTRAAFYWHLGLAVVSALLAAWLLGLGLRSDSVAPIGGADALVRQVLCRQGRIRFRYGDVGRGKIVLPLGPIEYWAYTSEPIRDIPLREQKIAEHDGDVWAAIYDLADHRPPTSGEQLIATRSAA